MRHETRQRRFAGGENPRRKIRIFVLCFAILPIVAATILTSAHAFSHGTAAKPHTADAASLGAQIATETVLYSFCSVGQFCSDGDYPTSALIEGTDGNYYGTTSGPSGTVFKVTPSGALTTLYTFCTQGFPNCPDGGDPSAGLVKGTDGNFYGATGGFAWDGSENDAYKGTVFKIAPSGVLITLYSFCSVLGPYCDDGQNPDSRLVEGSDGNFYGTTYVGGFVSPEPIVGNYGTVFKITPSGELTTLYSFGQTASDGVGPVAGLVEGSDGNFYGTTEQGGGPDSCGTVFEITPSGALTTLYSFCSQPNGADGGNPQASLVEGSDGNFYGTTSGGGTNKAGTVFKITPSGGLTTLHSFCSQPNCTDGRPGVEASLVEGSDGNFYGTTNVGGQNNCGTVFEITPSGTLTTLYSFCSKANRADGANPYSGLVEGSDGNFYGTTSSGGAHNVGTVFKLVVPSASPTPSATPTPSFTASATPTGTLTATPTITATPTVVATFTATATPTPTATATPGPSIGTAAGVTGSVTDNGKPLADGDTVSQNDDIEVSPGAQATLTFADGSTMSIPGGTQGAEIKLDEYVYDPETNQGSFSFSWLLRGAFEWTSGLMSHSEDNHIHSGYGDIGNRGTQFIARYLYAQDGVTTTGVEVDLIDGIVDVTPNQTQTTASFTGPITIVFNGSSVTTSPLTQDAYNAIKAELFSQPTDTLIPTGTVLVGTGNGLYTEFTQAGTILAALETASGSLGEDGCGFDSSGDLITTNFDANNATEFDPTGTILRLFGSGYNLDPQSVTFDAAGNVYTGQADGTHQILEFTTTGAPLATFSPAVENRGVDWIDLAADQCTMFYTSEGVNIFRYNICSNSQESNFNLAPLPNSAAFALRIRPNGEVVVADTAEVTRLDAGGNQIQHYLASTIEPSNPAPALSALALDPDGTSFWTSDQNSGVVFKVDIASGAILQSWSASGVAGFHDVEGLCVKGEIVVSQPTPSATATPTPTATATATTTATATATATPTPTVTATPTPTPVPVKLKIKPRALNFGKVKVGSSKSKNVSVSNPKGNKKNPGIPVIIRGVPNVADYTAINNCPATLPPGGKCKIQVTFTPSSTGEVKDSLMIDDNAMGDPQMVHLIGTGK